MKQWNSS